MPAVELFTCYRVSTARYWESGLGIEAQRAKLDLAGRLALRLGGGWAWGSGALWWCGWRAATPQPGSRTPPGQPDPPAPKRLHG